MNLTRSRRQKCPIFRGLSNKPEHRTGRVGCWTRHGGDSTFIHFASPPTNRTGSIYPNSIIATTGEPLSGAFSSPQCPLRASVADGWLWPTARAQDRARNLPLAPESLNELPPVIGCLSAIPGTRSSRERAKDLHTIDDVRVRVDHPMQ